MTTSTGTADPSMTDSDKTAQPVNWLAELRGLGLMLIAVLMFHSLVAKPFYIPSESMMPGLLKGDRLVVSKYPYGWSWASASFHLLPRGDWRINGFIPEYGDVVIPVHPERNEDYIKRVVGLPGDRLAVINGQIILNGTPVPQMVEPPIEIPVDGNSPCAAIDYPGMLKTKPSGKEVCEMPIYRETLPNGATYLIIDDRPNGALDNFDEIVIPEGHVFAMGDNRDHSADSRDMTGLGLGGPIPLENIGGRAEFITFSLDGSTGLNPISWFTSMRVDRAWTTLRPSKIETSAANERR